jgi:hypothetical protein
LLGGGDDVAGDDVQGGAVGVVAAEYLRRVVVGDVVDAASVGQGLLDLAGLTQPSNVGRPVQRQLDAVQP